MKGNRHIVAKDTPTANLLLALAHVGGAEIEESAGEYGQNRSLIELTVHTSRWSSGIIRFAAELAC